ncbi:leucine-rich repeat domain-containing protein [Streptomyces olivoreticuli]|uniref:leucine-rich repeat domain-containing protein n=1 Tax=Streptomyces olivoreticuli TaxID=68246 RepID=UPI0013C35AF9|nr:leucine-rich repeat domain-containing protein [Streptomyces olivoreticuli]
MVAAPDPQIARAVSLEVDSQKSPGAADISYLKVRHARAYAGLEECRALRFLILVGCGASTIPPLEPHRSLIQLAVSDSDLRTVGGIEVAQELHTLDLPRNFIEDLSPLLGCPQLQSLDVRGNPLSDETYRDVLPELQRRGVKMVVPTVQERDLMVRMRSISLPYSYYRMEESYRLSRPGLGLTDMPEADHIKIGPDELSRLVAADREALASIFERKDLMPTLRNP